MYTYRRKKSAAAPFWIFVGLFVTILTMLAAWLTHVITTIQALATPGGSEAVEIAVLVVGTLMAPIGVIHGIMIWFGAGLI